MQHPELFILRHGETEWNRARRMQGRFDSPLTELGREQAARQRDLLGGIDLPGGASFQVSPQGRAQSTARIVLGDRFAEAVTDERLREIHLGDWDGLTREAINGSAPGLDDYGMMGWMDLAPNGEGLDGIRARVSEWVAELRGPTVAICHGITSRMIRGVVLDLDLEGMEALPGGQGVIYHVRDGVHRLIG